MVNNLSILEHLSFSLQAVQVEISPFLERTDSMETLVKLVVEREFVVIIEVRERVVVLLVELRVKVSVMEVNVQVVLAEN